MAKYSEEFKGIVRALYLRRYTPKEIASELNLSNARIVYYWAEKYKWADLLSFESTEEAIERRYQLLASRDNKTDTDLKKWICLLLTPQSCAPRAISIKKSWPPAGERHAAARGIARMNRAANASTRKRYFVSDPEDFDTGRTNIFRISETPAPQYWPAGQEHPEKSPDRCNWYFAFEAFENAVMTGDPQIFLSASKARAEVFRSYIVNIAEQYFGITLTGNPIRLSNGAELRFLSTNKTPRSHTVAIFTVMNILGA